MEHVKRRYELKVRVSFVHVEKLKAYNELLNKPQ